MIDVYRIKVRVLYPDAICVRVYEKYCVFKESVVPEEIVGQGPTPEAAWSNAYRTLAARIKEVLKREESEVKP